MDGGGADSDRSPRPGERELSQPRACGLDWGEAVLDQLEPEERKREADPLNGGTAEMAPVLITRVVLFDEDVCAGRGGLDANLARQLRPQLEQLRIFGNHLLCLLRQPEPVRVPAALDQVRDLWKQLAGRVNAGLPPQEQHYRQGGHQPARDADRQKLRARPTATQCMPPTGTRPLRKCALPVTGIG